MSCLSIYFPGFYGPGPSGTEPESGVMISLSIYFLSLEGPVPSGTAGSGKYIPRSGGLTGCHSGISIYLPPDRQAINQLKTNNYDSRAVLLPG